MFISLVQALLAATALSTLTLGQKHMYNKKQFIIQAHSDSSAIDGTYLATYKRSPTDGQQLIMSSDMATPFFLGSKSQLRQGRGKPLFAEQTSGLNNTRVYFSTIVYGREVGSGFTNITCSFGPGSAKAERDLPCMNGEGQTGIYGCPGESETGGWFMYDTTTYPTTVPYQGEGCALMAFSAIPIEMAKEHVRALVTTTD